MTLRHRIRSALTSANSVDYQNIQQSFNASQRMLDKGRAFLWRHPILGHLGSAFVIVLVAAISFWLAKQLALPQQLQESILLFWVLALYLWTFFLIAVFPRSTLSYRDRWIFAATRLLEFYRDEKDQNTILEDLREFRTLTNDTRVKPLLTLIAVCFLPVIMSASVNNQFFQAIMTLDLLSAWKESHAGVLCLIGTPLLAAFALPSILYVSWAEHLILQLEKK